MNKANFTRADLIEAVSRETGLTKVASEAAVKAAFDAIALAVNSGRNAVLRGFCSFKPVAVPERNGHNPKTGEKIVLAEHRRVSCRATFRID